MCYWTKMKTFQDRLSCKKNIPHSGEMLFTTDHNLVTCRHLKIFEFSHKQDTGLILFDCGRLACMYSSKFVCMAPAWLTCSLPQQRYPCLSAKNSPVFWLKVQAKKENCITSWHLSDCRNHCLLKLFWFVWHLLYLS